MHGQLAMSSAARILSARGLLDPTMVQRAQRTARSSGATLVEELLLAGLLEEDAWCRILSEHLSLPAATGDELWAADAAALARLPAEVALEHRAVPFRVDGDGYLSVAMEDPGDRYAVGEVSFFAGAPLLRHVARASVLARALRRHYRVRTPLCRTARGATADEASTARGDEATAWLSALRAKLAGDRSADEVVRRLVASLAAHCGAAVYLPVDGGAIRAETVALPLETRTLLSELVAAPRVHRGPTGDEVARTFLCEALGRAVDAVAIVPAMARGRVLGLLCGASAPDTLAIAELAALGTAAGNALDRVMGSR
jgi:hypothetical protein